MIAVITPITIPSTVRKLRNLCERTLSSAIPSSFAQHTFWKF